MSKKIDNSILGIYIDVNKITLSISFIDKNKLNVSKLLHIPVDFKTEGIIKPLSLNNDFFSEKQKWVDSLKELIKKANFSTSKVVISLSHNFSITRFFVMPFIEKKFWNGAIPMESRKYIPVSFDELSYDFYAFSIEEGKKLGICFAVTTKKTVEFLIQQLKNLNMELMSIEPSPVSFVRFFSVINQDKNPQIITYFSDDDIYTSIVYNSIPVVFRTLSSSAAASFSERRNLDLKGSILFIQRLLPDVEIKKLIFSGVKFENYIEIGEKETQIKPEVLKVEDKVNISDISFNSIASISSSIRYQKKEMDFIDISEIEKNKKLDRVVKKSVISISGFISALFIFLFVINFTRNYFITQEINAFRKKMTEIGDFENMSIEQINDRIKLLRKNKEFLYKIITKRDYLAPKLSDLCDIIPRDIWLKEIFYSNPITINQDAGMKLEFTLSGETYLTGDQRTYYIDYFVKELKKNQNFYICLPPSGTLDYDVKNQEVSLSNNQLTPSIFRISCAMSR